MALYDPPNWRWLRAIELVDDLARPSRKDDEAVVKAFRFLKRKRAGNATRMGSLKEDYPDIFQANAIHEMENDFRWMMEAALCTTGSYEQISDDYKYGISELKAYEKLFFDVRSKLDSPPYVKAFIIQPSLRNRTSEEASPDFIHKVIALVLGYAALLNSYRIGHQSLENDRLADMAAKTRLKQLGMETTYTMPINRFNAIEILDKCLAVEQQESERPEAQSAAVEAVRELLDTIKFRRRRPEDIKTLTSDGREPRLLYTPDVSKKQENPSQD